MSTTRVFGVRHHGPGSARAVRAALERYSPDRLLIEGPPEADALVGLVAEPELRPPVAVLAYRNDDPAAAAFWPFAVFSPEWQALHWAVERDVPVSFMDLPAALVLGRPKDDDPAEQAPTEPHTDTDTDTDTEAEAATDTDDAATRLRTDPIALLAGAAGHDDPERWWEDVVENRSPDDPLDSFDAVTEAMTAVRTAHPEHDERTLQREAQMRKQLRAAVKAGAERVAVVCGAWHAPALAGTLPGKPPTATADNAVLRQLTATTQAAKVTATWVPWTHSRLASSSGYGAGVDSPGWYGHLFTATDHPLEHWLSATARVLRDHDLPTSTANVIEAVRLARTLAAVRERPEPGLTEVLDATRAVLCDGSDLSLGFVVREAVVGEQLGSVPDAAPTVPLTADVRATARSLRIKFDPKPREVVLDLRTRNDRRRSQLWWRLRILRVDWARPEQVTGTGTFKEGWTVAWRPELEVRLVEASLWGTTVASAAGHRLVDGADSLAGCASAIADAITAELPDVLGDLTGRLDRFAAASADITGLLQALPALVRAQRYGSVRGVDTGALADVAQAVLTRLCAGLPAAIGGLNDDAARDLRPHLEAAHEAVPLLPAGAARDGWYGALAEAADRRDLPALLGGRLVRLLMDADRMDRQAAADRLHAALSVGRDTTDKAWWVEGFTAGGALLLIHDRALLSVLDRWVAGLDADEFLLVAPLLRRGFGQFEPAERGNLLTAARALGGSDSARVADPGALAGVDLRVAAPVLATARLLLGEVRGR
ncbi:DUF5682 family protein [Nakamurella flava]|uniref:DUF5682 family protein n=1 Tax=Nakamurella flava TaxID=2576308 RepID=UPI00140D0806|nr:DUF5682 family protein [Nakamurella flava]